MDIMLPTTLFPSKYVCFQIDIAKDLYNFTLKIELQASKLLIFVPLP